MIKAVSSHGDQNNKRRREEKKKRSRQDKRKRKRKKRKKEICCLLDAMASMLSFIGWAVLPNVSHPSLYTTRQLLTDNSMRHPSCKASTTASQFALANQDPNRRRHGMRAIVDASLSALLPATSSTRCTRPSTRSKPTATSMARWACRPWLMTARSSRGFAGWRRSITRIR